MGGILALLLAAGLLGAGSSPARAGASGSGETHAATTVAASPGWRDV
ncbi:MAG: hypothetical protein GF330_10240, partial [Candidatus Eisenbacteria bacterium]|nr:hypothetical protein [Candidatus Eisenbacteria bacterium]